MMVSLVYHVVSEKAGRQAVIDGRERERERDIANNNKKGRKEEEQ